MISENEQRRLCELIYRIHDGVANETEFREFEDRLDTDPGALDLYYTITETLGPLMFPGEAMGVSYQPGETKQAEIAEIKARAEQRLQAFLEEERQRLQATEPQPALCAALMDGLERLYETIKLLIRIGLRTLKIGAWVFCTAVIIAALCLYLHRQRPVARLDAEVRARWDREVQPGMMLRRGPLALTEGYARLTMRKGAEVILQAPSIVELQSANGLFVESGALTARVPTRAQGFTVETPELNIIDYGTEFGLLVGFQDTELHVFQGAVGLTQETTGKIRSSTCQEGQALVVDMTGRVRTQALDDRSRLFARNLPLAGSLGLPGRRLDLADMVEGGNGFGSCRGQVKRYLDPATGAYTGFHLKREYEKYEDRWQKPTAQRYVPVPGNAYIDGVFVPDGGNPPVIVSSQAHTFVEAPDTCGVYWATIGSYGSRVTQEAYLEGYDPDSSEHSAIAMHANLGLTFDLAPIRASLARGRIRCFKARAGLSNKTKPDLAELDVWILVDGQVRLSATNIKAHKDVVIDVALEESDRFLSLVVTDNGIVHDPNELPTHYDWGVFLDPVLELVQDRPEGSVNKTEHANVM